MIGLIIATIGLAQTQQGYVKTRGRLDSKGNLIPGKGLKGATVSVHGRTTVLVQNDDGAFSFPVTDAQYRLDSVRKKGYQLVDLDAIGKTYKHSSNPLFLVMETPERQLQDQLEAERKIRRNLTDQLHQREDEIEALKEQQKISDEEYRLALQKLYQDQESNEQLIKDMAKRYSELDYDQMDEFYRQVSYYIENGELVKADSLLKTRGDIKKQVADILQQGQALQEEKEQLQKAEAVQEAEIEEAAKRCYSYVETFAALHQNDSAAYYLELRASLDTTNVEWQYEAVAFLVFYTADYVKALHYSRLGLRQAIAQFSEYSSWCATFYNSIGFVYDEQGDYGKALEYYNKALAINKTVLGESHPDVAQNYNNIGYIYSKQDDYEKALEYFYKALAIQKSVLGENNTAVATSYNNIGSVYGFQGDYDKNLEYLNKALAIQKSVLGENHTDVATSYNNIGSVYGFQGDYDKTLEYLNKALAILKYVLGEDNPHVALCYNNIGAVYSNQGDYDKALEYHFKALSIRESVFGETNHDVGTSYYNIGTAYFFRGDDEESFEYFSKALKIYTETLGPEHPTTQETRKSVRLIEFLLKNDR